jgi:hypothetical protein
MARWKYTAEEIVTALRGGEGVDGERKATPGVAGKGITWQTCIGGARRTTG